MAHLRLLPALDHDAFDALSAHLVRPEARALTSSRWGLEALRGRLVEISGLVGAATLTAAFDLVLEAQLAGEPVGWVMAQTASCFYVQDVVDSGVDLAALVMVRVGEPERMARVASRLLQSGGFGLVVIDLHGEALDALGDGEIEGGEAERGEAHADSALTTAIQLELSLGQQGKLAGLAKRHEATVACLSPRSADAPALSSLISLRVEATHGEDAAGNEHVVLHALKDKHRGPGWWHTIELAPASASVPASEPASDLVGEPRPAAVTRDLVGEPRPAVVPCDLVGEPRPAVVPCDLVGEPRPAVMPCDLVPRGDALRAKRAKPARGGGDLVVDLFAERDLRRRGDQ